MASQIRAIVPVVAERAGWAGVSIEDIAQFCTGLIDGRFPSFAADLDDFTWIGYVTTGGLLTSSYWAMLLVLTHHLIAISFVVTGSLLASCQGAGERWWDYLDRAEAVIEASLRSSPQQ